MEWIGRWWKGIKTGLWETSFTHSLFLYGVFGITGAAAAAVLSRYLTGLWLAVVLTRYNCEMVDRYLLLLLSEDAGYGAVAACLLLVLLNRAGAYLLVVLGAGFGIRLHYRQRVAPALRAVRQAAEDAAAGRVEQPIAWQGQDEMGLMCRQVDELRRTAAAWKRRQGEAAAELRIINAAFAHDIRTPLTIIRGHTQFLEKHLPQGKVSEEQLLHKLRIIREQEERLFAYSKTMNRIQNLELWEVNRTAVSSRELMDELQELTEGLAAGSEIRVIVRAGEDMGERILWIDGELVLEVLGNILNNALTFAAAGIWLEVTADDEYLSVYVRDDGPGFTDNGLKHAADAYYRGKRRETDESAAEHFGLGLAISRILAGRHGGWLSLVNSMEGGAIVTAVFEISGNT